MGATLYFGLGTLSFGMEDIQIVFSLSHVYFHAFDLYAMYRTSFVCVEFYLIFLHFFGVDTHDNSCRNHLY